MTDGEYSQVNSSDIDSVSQKLKALHDGLPAGERLVLEWLLARAGQAPGETGAGVQGYAAVDFFPAGSSLNLNPALGLGGAMNPGGNAAYKWSHADGRAWPSKYSGSA